jgi:hypothetical protein
LANFVSENNLFTVYKKKPDVDVIMDVLRQTQLAYPESVFINSLLQQYQERGGLSKKQLQGLHGKASKVKTIAAAKLATLDAIILKKHSKHISSKPEIVINPPLKDEAAAKQIAEILFKYPQHKRVLFYKMQSDKAHLFTATEKAEIERFYKLLV